jgi:hypothetical protein
MKGCRHDVFAHEGGSFVHAALECRMTNLGHVDCRPFPSARFVRLQSDVRR